MMLIQYDLHQADPEISVVQEFHALTPWLRRAPRWGSERQIDSLQV